MLLSAAIEGEKKYSPPFGTTQVGSCSSVDWLIGFVPTICRGEPCPMIGSKPGCAAAVFPGGNATLLAQPIAHLARKTVRNCTISARLTLLNELKGVGNVARVANEEQAALLGRLCRRSFSSGDLRSERNAATNDASWLSGDAIWYPGEVLEVSTGVCLADVRCERASSLRLSVMTKRKAKVVIASWVCADRRVVL